jgi:hypothetical protein
MKIKIFFLLLVITLVGCGVNNSRDKSKAIKLTQADFSDFGSDPWKGLIPLSEGDFICLEIDVTAQGTTRQIYTEYSYNYFAQNCWSETVRRTYVNFLKDNSKLTEKYIGKKIKLYGVVFRLDIKRPEHACDNAYVTVYLDDTEFEPIN